MSTNASSNHEAPMSGGESVHPNADFDALLTEYFSLSPDDKIAFFAEKLPGAAAIGHVAAQEEGYPLAARCREAINKILAAPENIDKTGVQLGFNRLPALFQLDPRLALLMSSNTLTPRDIKYVQENIKAHDGCTYSMAFQFHRQRDQSCAGVHTEGIAHPKSDEDGAPISLSLLLVPQGPEWEVGRSLLKEVIGCEQLGPIEPTGELSKAFNSPPGSKALGPPNMLAAVRRDDWVATIAELAMATKEAAPNREPCRPVRRVIFPTEVVTSWDVNKDGFSIILQIEALQQLSASRGETLTLGSHYGCASCEAYTYSILAFVRPDVFKGIDPCLLHLHELSDAIAERAERIWLAKEGRLNRIYDFGDLEKRASAFDDVSANPDLARRRLHLACNDGSLNLKVVPGMPSWQNMYNNFKSKHPSPAGNMLYLNAAQDTTEYLERLVPAALDTAPSQQQDTITAVVRQTPGGGWPVELEEIQVAAEQFVSAGEAAGIVVTQTPELGSDVSALLASMFKSIPDVGLMLVFAWGGVRYANLNDDGLTAPLHTDMGAAATFATVQPLVERFTEGFLTKYTGLFGPIEALPRGRKLIQDGTQAVIGGSLVGAVFGTVTALNKSNDLGVKLGYELAGAAPALFTFAAIKIATDVAVFRQKYQRVNTNDPARLQAKKTLVAALRDFVTFRHWLVNRVPKFTSLAIFPFVNTALVRAWNEAFGEGNYPQALFMIAFSYFFLSFNTLLNLAEYGHGITQPHVDRFMRTDIVKRLTGSTPGAHSS